MLPMGLCIATDIFQAQLGQLFANLENVIDIYIDDILVVTHGSFKEHIEVLEEVFDRLIKKGIETEECKRSENFFRHGQLLPLLPVL